MLCGKLIQVETHTASLVVYMNAWSKYTAGRMLLFFYELYTWPGYLVIMRKVSPIRVLSKSKERSGIRLSQLVFEGKKLCIAIMSATGQNHN